jgi:hypothetical protein
MAEDETVESAPDPVPAETTEETPVETLPLAPDNRPERNVLAEMNRKYTKLERQQADILAALQSLQQRGPTPAPVAPTPAAGAEYTDEQLGQLAAAGNAEAIRILVQRQTERATQAQFSQFSQTQSVQRAFGELVARYPMLRDDPSHPLTQAVYAARNQFLASGWAPGIQTDLEAIKAAIVNAPHLAQSAPTASVGESTRRAGVTAQQSMEGAASRRSPQTAQTQQAKPLSKDVAGIARRMNVKDPQNSMKRFLERQQAGRSTVSPAVQQAVRENEQA